jgi:putative restriction endonuclease
LNGYVGITDFEWYSFLRSRPRWEEVNFWQPSSHGLLNPPTGMPFFFKLRSEYGSPIVGYGHFSWRSKLPAWMAWESFKEANGAPDRAAMLTRIGRLRREPEFDPAGRYEIGCLLISQPVFFDKDRWVRPPADWPLAVQRGKSYDVTEGEGKRIYLECQQRAAGYPGGVAAGEGASRHEDQGVERFGRPQLVRPRLGQGGFRIAVADVYGRMCAISTEHSFPALEAAHIRRFADGGEHDVRNGLLLRADIHRLYDRGFVTVTPDYRFLVSRRLKDEYANGRVYYELQERVERAGCIHLPSDPAEHPNPDLLAWHTRERFVG